ncbi:MAG: MFS transporter [Phaeodactylibacter sp.]|nr:MFS transporter [Phaeodactylibacter sp.]MCB9052218.1 MFS transporter [Lewinellaceae bacterium]
MNRPRPPLSQVIIYAIGQLGWSLASFGAANLLVYFYMPPQSEATAVFPSYIYQGAVLGIGTIIGFVNFGGRLFDAVTDPLIAGWSDRMEAPNGKRRRLMGIAALPFALLSFLIFYPPAAEPGWINNLWLVGTIVLFYFFLTLYVIPYTALISELGHYPGDRMLISTVISVAWALGFLMGSNAYLLQSVFEKSFSSTQAFQLAIGLFALLSLVFMLVPVFFLQEKRYAYQQRLDAPPLDSLRSVFANRNFRFFLASDLMYWLALTFIQLGVSYFVTILFELDKAEATTFLAIGFVCSFLFYLPVNILVRKYGKKRLILAAFLVFSLIFALTAAVGWLDLPRRPLFYLLAVLSGFPLASFGIIPNAIIADVAHQHQASSGHYQPGMFYAVRNFMMKGGISLANLIFPSLLLLGKSAAQPAGVVAAAVLAVVFCLTGLVLFGFYREDGKAFHVGEIRVEG